MWWVWCSVWFLAQADLDALLLGASSQPHPLGVASEQVEKKEPLFQMGGLFFSRIESAFYEKVSLKKNVLVFPQMLDVFVDVRAHPRVRAFARGRVKYNPASSASLGFNAGFATAQNGVFLDQLWLKYDVWDTVFLTVGRQAVRFGAARFWNPTDTVNPARRNPWAVFDDRTGADVVKAQIPLPALGTTLYALVSPGVDGFLGSLGGVLRAEVLMKHMEWAFTASYHQNQPIRVGVDASGSWGPVDFWMEHALLYKDPQPFYTGSLDVKTFQEPQPHDRSSVWLSQSVWGLETGFKYNDQDAVRVGVEYFWNRRGYASSDLYPYLLYQNAFHPLFMGKHYVAGYVFLDKPFVFNNSSWTFSALGNASDRSWLTRFDLKTEWFQRVVGNFFVAYHGGGNGELHYQLHLPPVAFVQGLEKGVDVFAVSFEAGLGLRVSF